MFPSVKPLELLAGAVLCDQDDDWQESRYSSEKKMAGPYDRRSSRLQRTNPTAERELELRAIAKKAIDASLELADEMEAT